MRVWVTHSDCAKIIGRGGKQLKEIEARTHVAMKVQREDEMDPVLKERYVEIIGGAVAQQKALDMVLDLTTFCREEDGHVLKDIRGKKEGGDEARGDRDGHEGAEATEPLRVIEVLKEESGRVLGRKGETIRQLERASGARIDYDKTIGRVEIRGNQDVQEKAIELLLAEVSFARSEDGTVLKGTPRLTNDSGSVAAVMKIFILDKEAGKVIGRAGDTIREIMEKTGAEVKVQKSADSNRRGGTTEREVRIQGSKEQQDKALEIIMAELTWVKGEDGIMMKEPLEQDAKEAKEEQEAKEQQEAKEKKEKHEKERHDRERHERERQEKGRYERDRGRKGSSSAWICATCGGDHRTKECPHATGLEMGMQMGMQLGMQALGLAPGGLGPLGPPGLGSPMGPLGPMGPMGPLPGMLPGLMPPGMMPPGLPMPPFLRRAERRRRSESSEDSDSASNSSSGSSDPGDASTPAISAGLDAPVEQAPKGRARRHRRIHGSGVEAQTEQDGERRRRPRRRREDRPRDVPEPRGLAARVSRRDKDGRGHGRRRRSRSRAAAAGCEHRSKKKIPMSEL